MKMVQNIEPRDLYINIYVKLHIMVYKTQKWLLHELEPSELQSNINNPTCSNKNTP